MFTPSLRRAVRSIGSIGSIIPAPASYLYWTAFNTAHQPFRPTHQRRLSSSKPSIPPSNKKKAVGKLEETAPASLQKSERISEAGSRLDSIQTHWTDNLPQVPHVPPTQHYLEEVKVCDFFGLHRPLSLHPEAWQPPTSMDVFEAIFHQPSANNAYSIQQVEDILNSYLQALHDGIKQHEQMQAHARCLHAEANRIHMNQAPTEESITHHASQLPYFTPPPPPVAFDPLAAPPQPRILTAVMKQRITEVLLPFEQTEQAPTFREHVHRQRDGMYMISVKRQRKLKMKKHKYRKLMKRTRLERRKLDRA